MNNNFHVLFINTTSIHSDIQSLSHKNKNFQGKTEISMNLKGTINRSKLTVETNGSLLPYIGLD